MNIHPNAKGLIFDLDGTLINTMPAHYKACQAVCAEYGFEFPLDFFYECAGMPTLVVFDLLIKKLGLPHDPNEVGHKKEEKFFDFLHECKPMPGVADLAIKYHGELPMAIGSGGMRHTVERTLEATGFDKYFDIIVSSDDVEKTKPHPETFLKCAELINVEPQFCEVFEDGDPGLVAAKEAGMIATDIRLYQSVK